jgi:hypothetical protein
MTDETRRERHPDPPSLLPDTGGTYEYEPAVGKEPAALICTSSDGAGDVVSSGPLPADEVTARIEAARIANELRADSAEDREQGAYLAPGSGAEAEPAPSKTKPKK